jgi:SAM-dependent methyltransferase
VDVDDTPRPEEDWRVARRRRFHPESEFGGFTDLDGTLCFYLRVHELLPASGVAVDVGCGRGAQGDDRVRVRRELRTLRGKCRRVVGIDVDPDARNNQYVDEFRLIGDDGRWPLEDASADLAVADWVIEHVNDPDAFMAEAARVLRPRGHLCIRTVNARGYVGLASRLVPSGRHHGVLSRVTPGREERDVFPTLYRCNTIQKLRKALDRAGFEAVVYGFEGDPTYLEFSSPSYALGLLYRRLAPSPLRFGLRAWGRRR